MELTQRLDPMVRADSCAPDASTCTECVQGRVSGGSGGAQVAPVDDVGAQLRRWRQTSRLSQMSVALACDVSARHLSFVETGRARPSRDLILHLARHLRPTNRDLNRCLLAAGYAPAWLGDGAYDPPEPTEVLHEMVMLHDPNPAFLFDADWHVRRLNLAGQRLCGVLMPQLWTEVGDRPCGLDMIASLSHEGGLLSRLVDPLEVGSTLLRQLRLEQLTNPRLAPRADRVEMFLSNTYGTCVPDEPQRDPADPHLRLVFDTEFGRLSFLTIQSVVGIPQEITLGSLRTEVWHPTDEHTRRTLHADLAASG